MENKFRYTQTAVHKFGDESAIPFEPTDYSRLKFGDGTVARKFGRELANTLFHQQHHLLKTGRCVIIPSPYNFVENAASILTRYVVHYLNMLLKDCTVATSIVHRSISYTQDYGFLDKIKRESLLRGDTFYLNREFLKDKIPIFIDDVRITGAHEDKMLNFVQTGDIFKQCVFAYYAIYSGCKPSIESEINFAAVRDIHDYVELSKQPDHHLIVRPIKYLLSQELPVFIGIIEAMSASRVEELYSACIGEGYFKLPQYRHNFRILSRRYEAIST